MPVLDVDKLIENRVNAIRQFHKDAGVKRAQLDVSGGVDSAVMLGLLAKALGPENITAVFSSINSSDDAHWRAVATADVFGVKLIELSLSEWFDDLLQAIGDALDEKDFDMDALEAMADADPTIMGSIRSCLRAPVGRACNRLTGGGIRHGTGNECEDRWLRYYQKGGDGEVDTNPLAMLSKGEVYQLAVGLAVPESVLEATPSADLQAVGSQHNDEDELASLYGVPWTYSKVDMGGNYVSVGTIERLSRALDGMRDPEELLAAWKFNTDYWKNKIRENFEGYPDEGIEAYLESAAAIEKSTRHKWNPNCPSLGTRLDLLADEIITNELP